MGATHFISERKRTLVALQCQSRYVSTIGGQNLDLIHVPVAQEARLHTGDTCTTECVLTGGDPGKDGHWC